MQSCLATYIYATVSYILMMLLFSPRHQKNIYWDWELCLKSLIIWSLNHQNVNFLDKNWSIRVMLYLKMGIQTDPKKEEAISKWPVPTNMTEVKSFLGFTNYYWRFINEICPGSKTLIKTILGENASRKQNPIKWDPECQNAFDNLKELCTTTPILAYVDFVKPFKLHTDANVLGLGAVLYQVYEGWGKWLVMPVDP